MSQKLQSYKLHPKTFPGKTGTSQIPFTASAHSFHKLKENNNKKPHKTKPTTGKVSPNLKPVHRCEPGYIVLPSIQLTRYNMKQHQDAQMWQKPAENRKG